MPNLNQSLFGSANILGDRKASSKNIAATTNAQTRKSSELIKGYKPTIKNTIANTTPKDFSDLVQCGYGWLSLTFYVIFFNYLWIVLWVTIIDKNNYL